MSLPPQNETGGVSATGFVLSEEDISPEALNMLPEGFGAYGVATAGDVLKVVMVNYPSPKEYKELERLTGMLITVEIVDQETFEKVSEIAGKIINKPIELTKMLNDAITLKASDLHISVGSAPIVRVGGKLSTLENYRTLSSNDMVEAAKWIMGSEFDNFTGDLDKGFTFGNSRWRASIWRQRGSIAITLRLVPVEIPRLEDLGLPASVVNLSKVTQGLILFCGPTGSGKSTSMAALVDRVNRTSRKHIITIEDPIEYVHPSHQSVVHQREVGSDTKDFFTGLRSALRQDPDVILVGELRDSETMKTALNAAETGHLVLATVHASSAAGAVSRIVNSFSAEEQPQIRVQLATTLQASIVQLLLPDMRKENKRVLATEVLIGNNAVRSMIRDNRLHEIITVLDSQSQFGMSSMEKSLAVLAANKMVDYELAKTLASDIGNFEEHFKKNSKSGNSFDPMDNM